MTIEITTVDDNTTTIDSAVAYHVDEHGFLHVRAAGEGNIATFHANRWQAVVKLATK